MIKLTNQAINLIQIAETVGTVYTRDYTRNDNAIFTLKDNEKKVDLQI